MGFSSTLLQPSPHAFCYTAGTNDLQYRSDWERDALTISTTMPTQEHAGQQRPLPAFAGKEIWTLLGSSSAEGHSPSVPPAKELTAPWGCFPWVRWSQPQRLWPRPWRLDCPLWAPVCHQGTSVHLEGKSPQLQRPAPNWERFLLYFTCRSFAIQKWIEERAITKAIVWLKYLW